MIMMVIMMAWACRYQVRVLVIAQLQAVYTSVLDELSGATYYMDVATQQQ